LLQIFLHFIWLFETLFLYLLRKTLKELSRTDSIGKLISFNIIPRHSFCR